MRIALLSGIALAITLAAGGVNAADQAACMEKQQEYMKRLSVRAMPTDQENEYKSEIAGAVQRCTAGEADAWEEIEDKLPGK
jgi:hypothetical protein